MGRKKSKTAALKLDDPDGDVSERLLGDDENEPSEPVPTVNMSPMPELRVRRRRHARMVWLGIIALSTGIIAFVGIVAIFRAIEDAHHVVPKHRPVFPTQYEASVTVNMPYIGLVEPLYVHVDEARGLEKLSYYGDSDIYIFNTSGNAYQIIPVMHDLHCFRTDPSPLQHVFPNVTLFEAQRGVSYVNGRDCLSWKYVTPGNDPTADGLKGEYTLYVDQQTETPVRFQYVGRNPMLGGSHIDEYYLDYEYIRAGQQEDHIFSTLPSIMNCTNFSDIHGPTRNPLQDLEMLMPHGETTKDRLFAAFKGKYGKSYAGRAEEVQRMTNFHNNLRYINSINRQGLSYHLALNAFADLSHEERVQMHRSKRIKRAHNNGATGVHQVSMVDIPDEIDWRKKGAVTNVADQGSCGSCWTFGTTGALEGALFMQQHKLVNLSQQNLMDCSWDYGNMACEGGLDYQAYKWIMDAGGIEATSTYGPYRNLPDYCHFNASNAATKMTGFVNVTGLDALNDALATVGPLSVSIDAAQPSFYFYAGGYYDDPNCHSDLDSLDHSVVAVGTTMHKGQKYTIVKNSWSTHWGDNGYVLISQKDNTCGVATAATYPLLAPKA